MSIVYEKLAAVLLTGALAIAVYCSQITATPAQHISVESALQTTLTSGQVPPDLVITYDETHGLGGGTTITIRGSGHGESHSRQLKNTKPEVDKTIITQNQLLELIKVIASVKAWEHQTPDRDGVKD